jgi:hypothetical protein
VSSKLAWSRTLEPLARKANAHNKTSQHGCGEVSEVGEKLNVLCLSVFFVTMIVAKYVRCKWCLSSFDKPNPK